MKRILSTLMIIVSALLVLCSCNPEKTENKTKTYEITNDHDAPFKYEKEYEKYDSNKYQWKVVITDSTKAEYPFEVYQTWYYSKEENKLNLLFTDIDNQNMWLFVFSKNSADEKFSTKPELAYKMSIKASNPGGYLSSIWAWQSKHNHADFYRYD